jgi:hypothetical protein
MDLSIRPVTPEIMRERGADAFDRGLSINDHDMNPGSAAIKDWQSGWLWREREALADQQQDHAWATQQLAEACPP